MLTDVSDIVPELPEVETTLRGIAPHIEGLRLKDSVVRQTKLRWPVDTKHIDALIDQKLAGLSRRGKYLLFHFPKATALWHLGMSGSLRIVTPQTPAQKHDHIDWRFGRNTVLRFHDPRRFGALVITDAPPNEHSLLNHLGPEPLSDDFSADYLFGQSRKRKQAVKTWLMDAQMVVGVGNIYANESLYNAGIHPLKAAGKLTRKQCNKLYEEVTKVLQDAIHRGGTTLRDFVGGDGKPGYFAQELKVYGKGGAPCLQCGKALTEKMLNQRTTVYCTRCQN